MTRQGPVPISGAGPFAFDLRESLTSVYTRLMHTDTAAKITRYFLGQVLAGATVSQAMDATEAHVIEEARRLGSTTPEHGIRFIVRETLVSAL